MYAIRSPYWVFEDSARERQLASHIEQGDYFPYLASVIGLLKDAAEQCGCIPEAQGPFLEDLKENLIHLQEHYDLVPKATPVPYSRKKMIRF